MSNQPKWKCVAQLGDASPLEHGGLWVFVDTTGVYPPESEMYEPETRRVYRYVLENCTFINGVLSDNQFHPDMPVWFVDGGEFESLADTMGMEVTELIEQFVSVDPVERANAWRCVGEYFGYDNLDSYPLTLTEEEAARRYNGAMYQIKEV